MQEVIWIFSTLCRLSEWWPHELQKCETVDRTPISGSPLTGNDDVSRVENAFRESTWMSLRVDNSKLGIPVLAIKNVIQDKLKIFSTRCLFCSILFRKALLWDRTVYILFVVD